jgi:hypothetical protein
MLAKFCVFGAADNSSCSAFSGTWLGSFNVSNLDGKPMRDTAVLVLTGDCEAMTGSAGSSIKCKAERWKRTRGCEGEVYGNLDESQRKLETGACHKLRPSMSIE